MGKFSRFLSALFLIFSFLCEARGDSLVKPRPAPKPTRTYPEVELPHKIEKSRSTAVQREWTILYYLDADNDLEPFIMDDLDEMEVIGSTDNINLVAMVDRHPGYEPRDGNWANSKILYITRDADSAKLSSKIVEEYQEMDMADPQTLARFVAFGISNFPARKYALVLADHGGSWPGMLNDETNNEKGLTMGNLRSVFEALKSAGAPVLDLIVFDMCLMSQLEIMDVIAPYAKFAVASQELEPGEGYPNHKVLYSITKNPAMDAREYATSMVQAWADSYNQTGEALVTSAAIDLSKVPELVSAVSDLAAAMGKSSPQILAAIGRARSSSHYFGGKAGSRLDSYDLGNFVSLLARQPEAAALKPQSDRVLQALGSAVIKHEEGKAFPNASGLAIYFPFNSKIQEGYAALPFARTQWDEFLSSKGTAAQALAAGIQIQELNKETVYDLNDSSFRVPAKLSGTVTSVQMSFGYEDSKTGELIILNNDELMPGDVEIQEDGSFVAEWADGDELEITAEPVVTGITDGDTSVIAPLFPLSPGSKYSSAVGAYHSKLGDKEVSVVFDIDKQSLEALLCLSEGDTNNPMMVQPVKGDDLVLFQFVYKDENSDIGFRPVQSIEVSDKLKLVETALPAGEYILLLSAYGADGELAGLDWIQVKASGEGSVAGFQFPNYGFSSVEEEDLGFVDLSQIIDAVDYSDSEGDWDDYTDEYKEDDFDEDDLDYLDAVALDDEELDFEDEDLDDFDEEEEDEDVDTEAEEEEDDDGDSSGSTFVFRELPARSCTTTVDAVENHMWYLC